MIVLDKLSFSYRRGQPMFDGLSLELAAGRVYGLLGKNGVGKTTLMKLISGLRLAQGGVCEVLGKPAARRLPGVLAELQYVPDEVNLPAISGHQYLSCYAPFYPRFEHSRHQDLCARLEVDGRHRLDLLSHGQKKKFLLAFALASGCRILLLDEPTNGLDIPAKVALRALLGESRSAERLLVLSTHQVRDVAGLIDRVLILDQGRLVFQDDVLASVDLEVLFGAALQGDAQAITLALKGAA